MRGPGIPVAPDGVHLLSDQTGRASGEAFVYFVDKESAQEALIRDREKIGHRWGDVHLKVLLFGPWDWCVGILNDYDFIFYKNIRVRKSHMNFIVD